MSFLKFAYKLNKDIFIFKMVTKSKYCRDLMPIRKQEYKRELEEK
jgi:hypothetical protein